MNRALRVQKPSKPRSKLCNTKYLTSPQTVSTLVGMRSHARVPEPEGHTEPIQLHDRAVDNLAFIRDAMESTTRFTAVPGRGGMVMGVVGLVGAAVANAQPDPARWLVTWGVAALCGFSLAVFFTLRKARAVELPIRSGPGRKFALSLAPSLTVGGVLTGPLFLTGQAHLLPAVWLLLYGTAVLAAGVFSIRVVPLLGLCFLVLGTAAAFAPPGTGDLFMATGFGGLHLVFGFLIARRYGG